ncbi:MAG: hypothetical protein R3C10_27060 [Pirellulales bacterium]
MSRRPLSKSRVGDGRRSLRHEPLEDRQLLTVTPIGNPFLVNQSVGLVQKLTEEGSSLFIDGTGFQRRGDENSNRSVAVDHDGDFVVTWTTYGDADGDGSGVFMRLFGRDGSPLTPEIQVNTFTAGDQKNANVAIDADGDFVIVWESELQDPYDSSSGIFGQRFAANGTPISSEFQVHTSTVGDQVNPEVAMDYDGNFVVTWETQSQYGSFFNDVRAQKFTFEGERTGSELRVNNFNVPGIFPDKNPSISMSPSGDFVVAWSESLDIFARVYKADTTPYGSQFQVNVSDEMITPIYPGDIGHNPILPTQNLIQRTRKWRWTRRATSPLSGKAMGTTTLSHQTTSSTALASTSAVSISNLTTQRRSPTVFVRQEILPPAKRPPITPFCPTARSIRSSRHFRPRQTRMIQSTTPETFSVRRSTRA